MPFAQFPELMVFLALSSGLLFLAVAIGFMLKGPVRWVKISTLLLLVDGAVVFSLHAGWEAGLKLVAITVVLAVAAVGHALHHWRHPVRKQFEPAEPDLCPSHGRRSLRRWTREFEALGFTIHGDHKTYWKLLGRPRLIFVRFFTHHSEPLWVEVHVLADPKVVARMIVSDKSDSRAVLTCDRQADPELFRDPLTRIQRVPSASSCADMLEEHRKLAMTSEGGLHKLDDPVEGHLRLYEGWVQRLLASGQVRTVEPGWVALTPTKIPGMILRAYAAWFH